MLNFGHYRFSEKKDDWDLFSTFISVTLGPILSFLTLIITGYIVYEFNVYQKQKQEEAESEELQQATINLFKEFRSPQMSRARSTAWGVKLKWDGESGATSPQWVYRKALIEAMVTEEAKDKDGVKITGQELRAVNDMIAFYTMLGMYSNNENNIRELTYFYYPWWRSFLKELTQEWDKLTIACITDNSDLSNVAGFDKAVFAKNMCMNGTFDKLDLICGFDKLHLQNMICHFDSATFGNASAAQSAAVQTPTGIADGPEQNGGA